jgi:hypothetical protein
MGQTVTINTGLASNLMIREILAVHPARIQAAADTKNAAAIFPLLEAMAQLGALHIRYLDNFQRHVFLVKVGHCMLPRQFPADEVISLQADMQGKSDRSFSYRIQAWEKDHPVMAGDFWFSSADYDERFNAAVLQQHYRNLWTCLTSALPTA